ncbi:acyltransferase family protein [Pseudoclavibacter sp. RFBA6]|uniref:acyltransferase family protein n=1 Tax=Pseudoclavibacter sp. RFBA6 TaxID=2080573 RepID=UPI0011AFE4D2|nr:acyltransferase family protein [Pseudoclavibacter sp. RFBA6]
MDTFRGFAIILVIFGHVVSQPPLFGYEAPGWMQDIRVLFAPYRMEGLMLLSGMLLPRALKKPLGPYYLGKVRNIAWPYFVWAAIFLMLVLRNPTWMDPASWIATNWLWFIFFLFAYYAIAPALARVPNWLLAGAFWGGAVWLELGAGVDFGTTGISILLAACYYGGFFFAGAFVFDSGLVWKLKHRATLVVTGVIAAAFLVYRYRIDWDVYNDVLYVWGSIGTVLFVLGILQRLPARFAPPLQSIGRSSLVYYASHMPIIYLWMQLLAAVGIDSVPAVFVGAFVLPVVLGALLAHFQKSPWVGWLFVMPLFSARRGISVSSSQVA